MIRPEVIAAVLAEHDRQRELYGAQNYPNGTGQDSDLVPILENVRDLCSIKTDMMTVTWGEVLLEEVLEVLTERDREKLKAELIQVAAVSMAWASKL